MIVSNFRTLRKSISSNPSRNRLYSLSPTSPCSFTEALCGGIFVWFVAWLSLWGLLSILGVEDALHKSSLGAFLAVMGLWLSPFLSVIKWGLKIFKPNWQIWSCYSKGQQFLACLAFILFGCQLIGWGYSLMEKFITPTLVKKENRKLSLQKKALSKKQLSSTPSLSADKVYFIIWPLLSFGLFLLMMYLSKRPSYQKVNSLKNLSASSLPFSLWLGESTGILSNRWHHANLAEQQQVGLSLEDAAQNIVILGAIGSGKTTRAMHPLLLQLLDQECGGLIFDIKSDFKQAVSYLADLTQRSYTTIGINHNPVNLLAGLSPEIAASFLKSALLLSQNKIDSFWTDTAMELCRNVLGILLFTPQYYHLNGLYRYLFNPDFQETVYAEILAKDKTLDEEHLFKAHNYYVHTLFSSFDQKIRDGVTASILQILSPFQHPELISAFCTTQITQLHPIEQVLEGTIYLIDLPLARWGLGGKVIYTLIKLRFFNVMQQRTLNMTQNQIRPVFFMCDEYQEIISANKDGLSDLNFWDKSRSSKTIGIISSQSVSSFYAALGDRDLVHALLQNFRQKLIFRVEDDWTIAYCNRLLGQVETQRIVYSKGRSSGTQGQRSYSSNQSVSYQHRDLIDGQLFRNMDSHQLLALLSLQGIAADDILNVKPIFISANEKF